MKNVCNIVYFRTDKWQNLDSSLTERYAVEYPSTTFFCLFVFLSEMTQITLVVLSNELLYNVLDFRTQVGQYGKETVGSDRSGDGRLSEKSFVTLGSSRKFSKTLRPDASLYFLVELKARPRPNLSFYLKMASYPNEQTIEIRPSFGRKATGTKDPT